MLKLKTKVKILIVLTFLLFVSGCAKKNAVKSGTPENFKKASADMVSPSDTTSGKYYAPYTGEEVSKETAEKAAYMVSIENIAQARPQAGLNSADIVYEAMVEGGITRFFALFQSGDAAKIGPVRSMRTYFIDLAYEYNLPFAHCGGSADALNRISKEGAMSMNEMTNGSYYYRDTTIKVMEHSLFTSSEKIESLVAAKNFVRPSNVKLNFNKSFWDNSSLENATSVSIRFNSSYTSSYTFKDGLYYKAMNNIPSLNRGDNVPLAVKNIVIQNVNYRKRSGELLLDADLVGQGDGIIISNGKQIKVKWSKADLHSQTIFKDERGNIVPLNVGKTWWHLLDQNAKLTIS